MGPSPRQRTILVAEVGGPLRVTPGAPSSAQAAAVARSEARLGAYASPATAARKASHRGLAPADGARQALDRTAFEALAQRDDVPGAAGVLAIKFLMVGVDRARPTLFLINASRYSYHYDFATQALGLHVDLSTFNAETYFTDRRKNLAGQVIAHDELVDKTGMKGCYALEFWPTDPVKAPHVAAAYRALRRAMPFAAAALRYHPAGETQEALFAVDKAALRRRRVRSISTKELFDGVVYSPLNLGEGCGLLRIVGGAEGAGRPPSVRDVALFRTVPNDLGRVAGIITDTPQTPLSHINLKAKQDGTPNAYIKDAAVDPRVAAFVDKLVVYQVGPRDFEIRAATPEEVESRLEAQRPPKPQIPGRDLGPKDAAPLDRLGHADAKAFGAKTANVAELLKLLPDGTVPRGFGLPFSFYDAFMEANGLYEEAARTTSEPAFRADIAARDKMLKKLRKTIKEAPLPADLEAKILAVQRAFPTGLPIRCRSSTNNEDLVGFSGAGLYDSYTHRPDEGELGKTIRQVWASLWNLRAFDEREFYRVDHHAAAMGVLVHPNTDDERANGVAITRNVYDPNWPGFYVNAQVGESLVTNPDPGAVPDEFLISAIGPNGEYESQFIRRSSLVKQGDTVLRNGEVAALVRAMERIQEHFKRVYGRQDDVRFAMDIEFKIEKGGALIVKQARPVVG